MKMTNGEIRGTITLLVLLTLLMGAMWWCSRSDRPEMPAATPTYFNEDSALIQRRYLDDSTRRTNAATPRPSRKAAAKKHKNKRPSAPPATDIPSPLDRPVD